MVFRNTDKVSFFMLFTFYVSTLLVGYYFYEREDFLLLQIIEHYRIMHYPDYGGVLI